MAEDQLVLVTGASGYIAAHVVQQLLVAGYRVRGTVRSLNNEHKVAPLKELVPDAKHKLELVEADLTQDQGWNDAVAGCWAVMHVAAHLPSVTDDIPEQEFIETTVGGAKRVLTAAAAAGVKKIIITGSISSVHGAPTPFISDKTYTEEDLTDVHDPAVGAYARSKTLAETAAWDFVKDLPDSQRPELTVLLPTLVFGPPLLLCNKSSASVEIINMIMKHVYPGVPNCLNTTCDVRDVARAHLKCLVVPEAAGERIIIHSSTLWLKDLSQTLSEEFSPQGYYIFTNTLPYSLVWLFSLFNKKLSESGLLQKIGLSFEISNKKMLEVLDITPTDFTATIHDMVYAMVDLGITPKAKSYRKVGSRAEAQTT